MPKLGKGFINQRYSLPGKEGEQSIPHKNVSYREARQEMAEVIRGMLEVGALTMLEQWSRPVPLSRLAMTLGAGSDGVREMMDGLEEEEKVVVDRSRAEPFYSLP